MKTIQVSLPLKTQEMSQVFIFVECVLMIFLKKLKDKKQGKQHRLLIFLLKL